MARIARSTMLLLGLVALTLPLEAASAQTGLTFEAKRADLAADPTVVVLSGPIPAGPSPAGCPCAV